MDSVGEGEGGKIWENGIETCKISCMKRVASPGSMHDTGCLGLVHWDDPEGWTGEGGGRRVQDGVKGCRIIKGCIRLPCDCGNGFPQTWWLRTTGIYSLMVLGITRPLGRNQGVVKSVLPGSFVGESIPHFLRLPVAVSLPWFTAVSLQSLSPQSRQPFLLCLCQISFLPSL